MVEVFKTNVQQSTQANQLLVLLGSHFPDSKINFDLEDCDKILRIEGSDFLTHKVLYLLRSEGYVCRVLE